MTRLSMLRRSVLPRRALARALVLGAVAAAALSACSTSQPPVSARPVDFSNHAPIMLSVASVDVVDASRVPAGQASAPVPPSQAVQMWAQQRLRAAGTNGSARVTIRDASLIAVPLEKATSGVRGYFTNDQTMRYDGRIEVEISAEVSGAATHRGSTKAFVTRSVTTAENITPANRDATLQELVSRMMDELNARLDGGIRKDLSFAVLR